MTGIGKKKLRFNSHVGAIRTYPCEILVHSGPLPRRGRTHYGLTIPRDIKITSYKRKKRRI